MLPKCPVCIQEFLPRADGAPIEASAAPCGHVYCTPCAIQMTTIVLDPPSERRQAFKCGLRCPHPRPLTFSDFVPVRFSNVSVSLQSVNGTLIKSGQNHSVMFLKNYEDAARNTIRALDEQLDNIGTQRRLIAEERATLVGIRAELPQADRAYYRALDNLTALETRLYHLRLSQSEARPPSILESLNSAGSSAFPTNASLPIQPIVPPISQQVVVSSRPGSSHRPRRPEDGAPGGTQPQLHPARSIRPSAGPSTRLPAAGQPPAHTRAHIVPGRAISPTRNNRPSELSAASQTAAVFDYSTRPPITHASAEGFRQAPTSGLPMHLAPVAASQSQEHSDSVSAPISVEQTTAPQPIAHRSFAVVNGSAGLSGQIPAESDRGQSRLASTSNEAATIQLTQVPVPASASVASGDVPSTGMQQLSAIPQRPTEMVQPRIPHPEPVHEQPPAPSIPVEIRLAPENLLASSSQSASSTSVASSAVNSVAEMSEALSQTGLQLHHLPPVPTFNNDNRVAPVTETQQPDRRRTQARAPPQASEVSDGMSPAPPVPGAFEPEPEPRRRRAATVGERLRRAQALMSSQAVAGPSLSSLPLLPPTAATRQQRTPATGAASTRPKKSRSRAK